jgi:phosphoribosylaminoimidazolecarboxamide formyltransferase/IMP cyclohydrolase
MDVKVKTALVSVSDKRGVVDFAEKLSQMGVKIISTGGTARAMKEAGVKVLGIESVTGFPEMMDGRVKTLHPKIHGGLLGLRDKAEHTGAMKEHDIEPIDLVCVNLYPFEATIAKPGCTLAEAIENIDIGGPSMLRSAAKNHRFVTVVTSPQQYGRVIEEMDKKDGAVSEELRSDYARVAFGLTASYDAAISKYLNKRAGLDYPERVSVALTKEASLRYGENPHQTAAFYKLAASGETSVSSAGLLEGGTPISFNNLLDTNAAFELVKEFGEPAAVVVKHLNPCGCAVDEDIIEAYRKAYEGDVVSAFGSIVALNRNVDVELARTIMESYSRFGKAREAGGFFAEVIIAPKFEQDAVEIIRTLKAWGGRVRLMSSLKIYGSPGWLPSIPRATRLCWSRTEKYWGWAPVR